MKRRFAIVLAMGMLATVLAAVPAAAAAGVTVTSNGTVKVTGTNADDTLVIEPIGSANAVSIDLNGDMTDVVILKHLIIDLKGGTNYAAVDADVPKDLIYKGKNGDDHVFLDDAFIGDDLIVNTQGGNDVVASDGVWVNDDTIIKTGTGDDEVAIGIDIFSGYPKDSNPNHLGDRVKILTSFGSDEVTLFRTTVHGKVLVSTAEDHGDVIGVWSSTFHKDAVFKAGKGQDGINLGDSHFMANVTFDGDNGTEDAYDYLNSWITPGAFEGSGPIIVDGVRTDINIQCFGNPLGCFPPPLP